MTPQLRDATTADLEAILALENRAFTSDRFNARQFRYLLHRAHASFLIAVEQEMLLGYAVALYRRNSSRARLYTIAVAETARGKGIGSALISALAEAAQRRGCRELTLEVRADNQAARRLYEMLGFRTLCSLAHYYEDGAPGLRMLLPLGP